MKRRLAQLTIVIAIVAGGALPAHAFSVTPVSPISSSKLKAACAEHGGSFYGSKTAYGCTKVHADGSSDTYECSKGKCNHVHLDPIA